MTFWHSCYYIHVPLPLVRNIKSVYILYCFFFMAPGPNEQGAYCFWSVCPSFCPSICPSICHRICHKTLNLASHMDMPQRITMKLHICVAHDQYLTCIPFWGQEVKGQGHRGQTTCCGKNLWGAFVTFGDILFSPVK